MKFRQQYSKDFVSDGSDTLTFDIADPPFGIEGEPTEISDVIYTQRVRVPASPPIKTATLSGTTVEVVWAYALPEKDQELQLAVYTLTFTLTF